MPRRQSTQRPTGRSSSLLSFSPHSSLTSILPACAPNWQRPMASLSLMSHKKRLGDWINLLSCPETFHSPDTSFRNPKPQGSLFCLMSDKSIILIIPMGFSGYSSNWRAIKLLNLGKVHVKRCYVGNNVTSWYSLMLRILLSLVISSSCAQQNIQLAYLFLKVTEL